ncbi:MAG: hypothetical protein IJ173_05040 [Kiritimatiellae bacterium]|nr:hypothetical protein [Kiritimatiellia bacterium]
MPAAIAFECEVSERGIADFIKALSRYQRETQRDMRSALRSVTIDLIRSLRARTRRSRKFIDRMEISKSYLPPKWIKRGHSGRPLRRMQLMRWGNGTNWLDHRYVYGGEYVRGPKGGQRVRPFSEAQMRREAQRNYGQIRNWGLAKKSWGWFMKSLFHASMQDENPKALIKPGMVDGGIQEFREVLPDGTVDRMAPVRCDIDIVNRLEYIRKAMPPGVFAIAVQKATNLINHKINAGLKSRRFGT